MAIFNGTPGVDQLRGTASGDQLNGLDGDDVIIGGGGADTIDGGAGNDRFTWTMLDGSDVIEGGTGNDTLFLTGSTVAEAFDLSAAGSHVSVIAGANTHDVHGVETINIKPSSGADRVVVGDLRATDARNFVIDLSGSGPTDAAQIFLLGAPTANIMTIQALSASSVRMFDTADGIQQTTNLSVLDASDRVSIGGGEGADSITVTTPGGAPSAATLLLFGDGGDDTITGSSGAEIMFGHLDRDLLKGGGGADTIDGGIGDDTLDGGAAADSISGGAGFDQILSDFSLAGAGPDVVDGGADFDTDIFTATGGADTVVLAQGGGRTTVSLNGPVALDMTSVEEVSVRAGAGADRIDVNFLSLTQTRSVKVDLSGATLGKADGAADVVAVASVGGGSENIQIGATFDRTLLRILKEIPGSNSITDISSLETGDRVTVNAAEGDDHLTVSSTSLGQLTFDGGTGADSLEFVPVADRTTFSANGSHLISGDAVFDMASIESFDLRLDTGFGIGRVDTVTVQGGEADGFYDAEMPTGADTNIFWSEAGSAPLLRVHGAEVQDRIVIDAAGGDDLLAWRGGFVTFEGGAGFDSVSVNVRDGGGGVVSSGQVVISTKSVFGALALHDVERLELFGNLTGAQFDLGDLTGGGVSVYDIFLGGPNSGQDFITLAGTTGADRVELFGTSVSDVTLDGLPADVNLHGWSPADQIHFDAGGGNDFFRAFDITARLFLTGGEGNDILNGGFGPNTLIGGAGNDILQSPGSTNDLLIGDEGDDILFGGVGNDIVVFSGGAFGHDEILEFQAHLGSIVRDRIQLLNTGFHSYSELLAANRVLQTDEGVVITISPEASIFLPRMVASFLGDSDFIFSI